MNDNRKEWDNLFIDVSSDVLDDTKIETATSNSVYTQEIKYGEGKPHRIYIRGDIKENDRNR